MVLLQTSPESADIFVLLQRIFRKQTPEQLEQVAKAAGLSSEEYQVHSYVFHCGLQCSHYKTCPFYKTADFYMLSVGLLGVCCWSICKYGQLQVFRRHQIHSKSTKGKQKNKILVVNVVNQIISL